MSEEKREAEEVCSLCRYHRTAGIHVFLSLPGSHRFRAKAASITEAHSPVLDITDRLQAERDAFLATIEQQQKQIEALSAFVGSFTPPTIQALQAKCTALEKERDGLAQNNLDCREVLVTLFINEGNTEEIARLSVQEVLGEASCQK